MALALVSYFVQWSEVLIEKGENRVHVSAALASIIACNPRSEVRRQSHVPVLHMLDSCGILFLAVLRAHFKGRLLLTGDIVLA